MNHFTILSPLTLAMVLASNTAVAAESAPQVPVNLPPPKAGQYVHEVPTIDSLIENDKMKPQLRSVVLKGYDLFMNTQQLRGENVFNDMNCRTCHMGEGRKSWAAPVWPAATTLPNFRGKNKHVNSVEERIAGCFAFSMNGKPPAYGSDTMLSLVAYHKWMATKAPMYEGNIAGRGFGKLAKPAQEPDYQRGAKVFKDNCVICHGEQGEGQTARGEVVFPPLWGDGAYNWGAGMVRLKTASAFIKHNMPLGKPGTLSDQQAWDVAYYIDAQERPQDPRFTGDVKETREKYLNFHKHSLYGTVVNGKLLGDHKNTGEKPFLKPFNLRPRDFAQGSDQL